MYDRDGLIELVRERALKFGDFTLASGKKASFYLDCRQVTLDPKGANLIGEGILHLLSDQLPDAVGGMAIGADPITAAVITLAGQRELSVRGFIVRKEAKGHGMGRDVEGPVQKGDRVVILEDTVTTGGSSLRAIQRVQEAGLEVAGVIAVIDRQEGAAAAFAQQQINFRSLLTVQDLGLEPVR